MTSIPFPCRDSIEECYQTDDIYDFVGQGSFASVYKAICQMNTDKLQEGQEVALKLINKKDLVTQKMCVDIINEVEILRRVDHPNCVGLLDYFQTTNHVVIVMNFVEGKELFQALRETDFTEAMVRNVVQQILTALHYLHDGLRIVHRDIKPENVLVSSRHDSEEYHVTIVDFGLARSFGRLSTRRRVGNLAFTQMQRLSQGMPGAGSIESLDTGDSPLLTTPCGTLKYAAPETIKSISESSRLNTTRNLLPRVDVYATGTLMYVMLCGTLPFNDFSNKASLCREMERGPPWDGARWENISPEAIEVNQALLLIEPKLRPRAEEALKLTWFHQSPDFHIQSLATSRPPVDAIIGERETMIKAFAAMCPPEGELYGQMDGSHGVPPLGSRCISVPFGTAQNGYFDV